MRVSVAGVVVDGGKFMVALRKPGTSIGESWEFPGGKIKAGEDPQEGLVREYLEELNLEIRVGRQIHESVFSNRKEEYRLLAFRIEIIGGELRSPEHQELRWVSMDELLELPMADSDRAIARTLEGLYRDSP